MASFSAQDAINKSSMSEDVRVAGESVGIDVDKLRKKYLTQKLTANLAAGGSEDQLKVKQQLDDAARMRAMESEAGCGSGSESSKDDKKMEETKKRLDMLVICSRCNGQGIVKESYNFQVKDRNCDECEAEGIMYKDPETGKLLTQSEAPKVKASAYNVPGLEEKARALAETTGLSSSGGLKETDLDVPPALM